MLGSAEMASNQPRSTGFVRALGLFSIGLIGFIGFMEFIGVHRVFRGL